MLEVGVLEHDQINLARIRGLWGVLQDLQEEVYCRTSGDELWLSTAAAVSAGLFNDLPASANGGSIPGPDDFGGGGDLEALFGDGEGDDPWGLFSAEAPDAEAGTISLQTEQQEDRYAQVMDRIAWEAIGSPARAGVVPVELDPPVASTERLALLLERQFALGRGTSAAVLNPEHQAQGKIARVFHQTGSDPARTALALWIPGAELNRDRAATHFTLDTILHNSPRAVEMVMIPSDLPDSLSISRRMPVPIELPNGMPVELTARVGKGENFQILVEEVPADRSLQTIQALAVLLVDLTTPPAAGLESFEAEVREGRILAGGA
ncbi:MAG: hypothetical protein COV76_06215 [Candidatus Omnitrophica bacterium CG11_big_fil_rev_8_21_14_0_20_64_10]|nr:MAG: hypothetical protein COV76_06215 [Candidatus Omnitrophica bacterium CG11_big_fil_rev_8_21_14_0_20_64_10]